MLFLSGIVGLAMYVFFLAGIFKGRRNARAPEKFLIVGALLSIVLHSVSTLPTLYASYMYLLMSVFAYASLPFSTKYALTRNAKPGDAGNPVEIGTGIQPDLIS